MMINRARRLMLLASGKGIDHDCQSSIHTDVSLGTIHVHVVFDSGHVPIITYLLDRGVSVNTTEETLSQTLLHVACDRQLGDVASLLIQRGADPTIKVMARWLLRRVHYYDDLMAFSVVWFRTHWGIHRCILQLLKATLALLAHYWSIL